MKLPPGPGARHGGNSREKFTRKFTRRSAPIWDPIFDPHFRAPFRASWGPRWKNSRDAPGHSRAPFLVAFGPCFGPSLASPSELAFGIKTGPQALALRRISTISVHTAQEGDTAFGVIGYRVGSGGILEARTPGEAAAISHKAAACTTIENPSNASRILRRTY